MHYFDSLPHEEPETAATARNGSNHEFWWACTDLNREPKDYESSALTVELQARSWIA